MATTVITTTAAGNWSAGGTWTGGSKPAAGQVASIGHNVTVDSDQTVGTGGPTSPAVLGGGDKPVLSSVGGGGSLPTGTYFARVTHVDGSGNESTPGCASASLSLTNGNTLRATFADALSGTATTRNLYLTSGAVGTEKLYATGITAGTYDCTSASWTDGTTSQASAVSYPVCSGLRFTAAVTLTVAEGVKLTVKGDVKTFHLSAVTLGTNGGSTGNAGVEFDAPSGENYTLWYSDTFGAKFTLNAYGLASTFNAYFRWKTGGGSVVFADGMSPSSGGNWGGHFFYSLNNCTVKIGNASNSSLWTSTATGSGVCRNVDFNGGGKLDVSAGAAGMSVDWQDVWFQNQLHSTYPASFTNSASPTATRTLERVRFVDTVARPKLGGNSTKHRYCYFGAGIDVTGGGNPSPWHSTEGLYRCWVRSVDSSNYDATLGNVYDSLIAKDSTLAYAYSSTAASGTGTTLTASGSPGWTTNQYRADGTGGGHGWCVFITGGTGVGQCRSICANTSSVLTVSRSWDTNPDATSTFSILDHIPNPHYLTRGAINGVTLTFDGVVWWNPGADNNGDATNTQNGVSGGTTQFRRCIGLPSAARDNTGTISSTDNSTLSATSYEHCTWFNGAQSPLDLDEGGNTPANTITSFQSNILWCDPAQVTKYTLNGGAITPDGGSVLGPYKVNTVATPISSTPQSITTADYNCGWGYKTGAYAGAGYNANISSPGAHDQDVDPAFVNRWANPATWAKSAGYTASDDTRTQWLAACSAIQTDPTRMDAYLTYQRGALAPTNTAVRNAGHDGVTIGAVEGVFAAASRLGLLGVG